jgi:IS605 OrfB family transposase
MPTLTYCKGLPTPIEELTLLGSTEFELFLTAFAPIFKAAVCETVKKIFDSGIDKSKWNTHLQLKFGINKRQANGVISHALGKVNSASECRTNHLANLSGKLKSAEQWVTRQQKKIKKAQKFYSKKNWVNSKKCCGFPVSSNLETRKTNWHNLKFNLHHKQRYIYQLSKKNEYLKNQPLRVKVVDNDILIVGSKDETLGNQICQWNGNRIKFRVPSCLESKFGKYVETQLGNFDRNIHRLPPNGAKTWHFYRKNQKWVVAVQFTPVEVEQVSRKKCYGAIGIDLNPGSIGWSYVDSCGNLKAHGQIKLLTNLPSGKQISQITNACLKLAELASKYSCPVICEDLDFTSKKEQLREKGRKYARMLSGFAYSRFFQILLSILSNRGIELIKVNPAFTSLIGLVKYARMYGLPSDCAAAIAIARRGIGNLERIPNSITAYLQVNGRKHVWSYWGQLNRKIKQARVRRHDFYSFL